MLGQFDRRRYDYRDVNHFYAGDLHVMRANSRLLVLVRASDRAHARLRDYRRRIEGNYRDPGTYGRNKGFKKLPFPSYPFGPPALDIVSKGIVFGDRALVRASNAHRFSPPLVRHFTTAVRLNESFSTIDYPRRFNRAVRARDETRFLRKPLIDVNLTHARMTLRVIRGN